MKQVKILNILINNSSQNELLEQIKEGVVFTPNVDHLVKLQKDRGFLRAYSIADYKLCDSKILLYASRFLGSPIKEKVSGSDFFPAFYNYHRNNPSIKIFLLGADKGVAKKAQDSINKKVKRNIVVGSYSPLFGFENTEEECLNIVDMVNRSGATVLAVGVGAPKQEKWIYKYKHKLPNIKIFLAIGATIDFEAGNVKRAPQWMSNVGLEWLHRLLSEPKRLWKRYLIEDLPFFWLILKQKLSLYTLSSNQGQLANLEIKPLEEIHKENTAISYGGIDSINKVATPASLRLERSTNRLKPTSSINLMGMKVQQHKLKQHRKTRPKLYTR